MHENEIAKIVLDVCFEMHRELGPGLLESVYQRILASELRKRELSVREEMPIPIVYEGIRFDIAFRADILVADKVLLELKSVEHLTKIHYKVTLTYVKLAKFKLGLLINFGEALLKDGISRIVNGLEQ